MYCWGYPKPCPNRVVLLPQEARGLVRQTKTADRRSRDDATDAKDAADATDAANANDAADSSDAADTTGERRSNRNSDPRGLRQKLLFFMRGAFNR